MTITDNGSRTVTALESNVDGSDGVLIIARPSGFLGSTSIQITIAEIARILRHFDKRGKEETRETK